MIYSIQQSIKLFKQLKENPISIMKIFVCYILPVLMYEAQTQILNHDNFYDTVDNTKGCGKSL